MKQVDEKFMKRALMLAAKGGRAVAPNPMVGAVIVKDNVIIGEGYHQEFGGPHAEVLAIQSVKDPEGLKGSTLYVTLEPCRHYGKTPPCQKLINEVGIERVICGSRDPFQKCVVRSAKCVENKCYAPSTTAPSTKFIDGKLAKECENLNKFFFTWVTKKRPYITVKVATSADGCVAGLNGKTVHFTSEAQDKRTHKLRAEHQAILVGSNTVLNDNPHLGVRHAKGQDPLRIILDSQKRVPKTAKVFRDKNYLHITKRIPLKTLFKDFSERGISSVLVEPGPTLYRLLKRENLIDELIVLKGKKKLGEGMKIEL